METLAAYIELLTFALRVVKYGGTRRVQRSLVSALRAVEKNQVQISVEDARSIVRDVLVRKLGVTDATSVTNAIAVIEAVFVDFDSDGFRQTRESLLPYGHILKQVIGRIGQLLHHRDAFQAYGVELHSYRRLLILPYSWNLFSKNIIRPPKPTWEGSSLYLEQNPWPSPPVYNLTVYGQSPGKFSHWSVRFSTYEISFTGSGTYESQPKSIRLDIAVFEALLLGLIQDLIVYDRRIRHEIYYTGSLLDSLFRIGKLKPPI